MYGSQNECARRTAAVFNERHPDKNVSHTYVLNLMKKFTQTGSVANIKHNESRVLNETAQLEVLGHFGINPNTSLRQVSRATGISLGSVHKVVKLHKFHPYKLKIHQELTEDDFDRRIQFCEEVTTIINNNNVFVKNICFSDECTFSLNGFVNKHNCRYWSNENPHLTVEGHTQYPEKVNVWAGILGDQVIGPVFIDGNLNGEVYLDMLENTINPLITEALENQLDREENALLDENELHFQQDGAPPHYVLPVRQWLDNTFPNRWITRFDAIRLFLWGHLKSVVFTPQPQNLEELRQRITAACRGIQREVFENVRRSFEQRLYHCLANNGQHFEQLLS
nr:uncharacterized protein LOC111427283 [Onthophagus taurus]